MQASHPSADAVKVARPIRDGLNTDLHLDIGNGISLENVDSLFTVLIVSRLVEWLPVGADMEEERDDEIPH